MGGSVTYSVRYVLYVYMYCVLFVLLGCVVVLSPPPVFILLLSHRGEIMYVLCFLSRQFWFYFEKQSFPVLF